MSFDTACLTIVRAYRLTGCPGKLPTIGSYGEWSDYVRSALVWLGQADPAASMDRIREEDPYIAEAREVLGALAASFGTGVACAFTAKAAKARAEEAGQSELHEALAGVAGDASGINTRKLGLWLSQHAGRPFGRLMQEKHADRNGHGATFRIKAVHE